jgi:hypothetical protein
VEAPGRENPVTATRASHTPHLRAVAEVERARFTDAQPRATSTP